MDGGRWVAETRSERAETSRSLSLALRASVAGAFAVKGLLHGYVTPICAAVAPGSCADRQDCVTHGSDRPT